MVPKKVRGTTLGGDYFSYDRTVHQSRTFDPFFHSLNDITHYYYVHTLFHMQVTGEKMSC